MSWLPYAFGAAVFFASANATASYVTAKVNGLGCVFYLSSGGVVLGLFFNVSKSLYNSEAGKTCWNN